MPGSSLVKPRLALVAGEHAHPPNVVFIPAGRKSFRVTVSMTFETPETTVVGSPKRSHTHPWTVLDGHLRQVMGGEARHGLKVGPKNADASQMLMAGGENRDDFDLDFTTAKLADGRAYTLICKSFGAVASLDFVAVAAPKASAAKGATKARRKPAAKKTAKKAAKKTVKKTTAKKKTAKKKAKTKAK